MLVAISNVFIGRIAHNISSQHGIVQFFHFLGGVVQGLFLNMLKSYFVVSSRRLSSAMFSAILYNVIFSKMQQTNNMTEIVFDLIFLGSIILGSLCFVIEHVSRYKVIVKNQLYIFYFTLIVIQTYVTMIHFSCIMLNVPDDHN